MSRDPRFAVTIRHMLTMLMGAGSAQMIPVLVSPLLTRLYTPQEFGTFAVFLAFVIPLTLVAAGRYDMSIMVASDDTEAGRLTRISSILAVCTSLTTLTLAAVALLVSREERAEDLIQVSLIGALAVASGSCFSSWSYWLIRIGSHRRASWALTLRGSIMAALQVMLGLAGVGYLGLAISYAVAPGLTILLLAGYKSSQRPQPSRDTKHATTWRQLLKEHREFPLFTAPAALVNNGTHTATTLLWGGLFGATSLGHYSLVQRSLGLPTVLAGQSIGQILFRDASREFAKSGSASQAARRSTFILSSVAIPFFTLVFFLSPWAFPFVFGEEWAVAGTFAQIMTPLFAVRFIASPVAVVNQATGNNKFGLLANLVLLSSTLLTWFVGAQTEGSAQEVLWALTVVQSVFYIGFLWEVLRRNRKVA